MNCWLLWLWTGLMACNAAMAMAQPIPADAMARPARPKSFASPDDLRTYLDQLGQYYAVAGRPRFGKRAGGINPRLHLAVDGVNYRYPLADASDLYDLLFQQQSTE
ncbi:pro-neuropeptide Y-like [Rhodnius prolixus]|uniref:Long neuropeptide F n=2 Tax=Rhodnius prolixus TaxID=13249 RepID=A0A146BJC1_RHOPR|nr:long neuropeptide F [Rhodnius prolixus]